MKGILKVVFHGVDNVSVRLLKVLGKNGSLSDGLRKVSSILGSSFDAIKRTITRWTREAAEKVGRGVDQLLGKIDDMLNKALDALQRMVDDLAVRIELGPLPEQAKRLSPEEVTKLGRLRYQKELMEQLNGEQLARVLRNQNADEMVERLGIENIRKLTETERMGEIAGALTIDQLEKLVGLEHMAAYAEVMTVEEIGKLLNLSRLNEIVSGMTTEQLTKAIKIVNLEGVIHKIGVEKVGELVKSPKKILVTFVEGKGKNEIIFVNDSNTVCQWYLHRNKNGIKADIQNFLGSAKEDKKLEGEIADFIQKEFGTEIVQGIGIKIDNLSEFGDAAGDIDVLLQNYLIEVKTSYASLDMGQIEKYINKSHGQYFNHENRKVIVYIKEPLDMSDIYVRRDMEELRNNGVIVVTSYEQLRKVLEK